MKFPQKKSFTEILRNFINYLKFKIQNFKNVASLFDGRHEANNVLGINERAKLIFNPMSMENDITFANLLLLSQSILPLSHCHYLRLYLYIYSL